MMGIPAKLSNTWDTHHVTLNINRIASGDSDSGTHLLNQLSGAGKGFGGSVPGGPLATDSTRLAAVSVRIPQGATK